MNLVKNNKYGRRDVMHKCNPPSIQKTIAFYRDNCESWAHALALNTKYHVSVEAYEELPPWSLVHNANGSDHFLKDNIIMLKVCDLEKRLVYYPVFPEKMGLRLLEAWEMPVPPKLTAFEQDNEADENVHPANRSLRNLIAFARLFMLTQSRWHKPMAYNFNNIISQLYLVPDTGVSPETIQLINNVIGEYINDDSQEHYIKCANLQDFLAYLKNKYMLVPFKSDDFRCLRQLLHSTYPKEKLYF